MKKKTTTTRVKEAIKVFGLSTRKGRIATYQDGKDRGRVDLGEGKNKAKHQS